MLIASIQRAFDIKDFVCFLLNFDHVSCDCSVVTEFDIPISIIDLKILLVSGNVTEDEMLLEYCKTMRYH